jgi:hypothetical protein
LEYFAELATTIPGVVAFGEQVEKFVDGSLLLLL